MKQKFLLTKQRVRQAQCCCCMGALLTGVSALTQMSKERFLLTSTQIIGVMQRQQFPTDGVDVNISAPITASVAEPILDIQKTSLINPRTAYLKVACRNHSQCLPFYVTATWPEALDELSIRTLLRHYGIIVQSVAIPAKPSTSKGVLDEHEMTKAENMLAVHTGSTATLLMEHERVHIRVAVVCLEGGSAGDKVRVITTDRKQAYVAEIVSPTLLKGTF